MNRSEHARAPEGASGTCRDRRRPREERQRPAWVRPFLRANRAISASARLISSTLRSVSAAERGVQRRPLCSSWRMYTASARLDAASARLCRAARDLAATNECLAREPELPANAPELLIETTRNLVLVTAWLDQVAEGVVASHAAVLHGLENGTLVAERRAERRPRIRLAPRPAPIRAFLQARQPRVIDRIAPILRRRRRTPRPTAVRVPRRSRLGRAPPSSLSPL